MEACLQTKNAESSIATEKMIDELQSRVAQMSDILKSKDEELMANTSKLVELETFDNQQISELEGKYLAQEGKMRTLEETSTHLKACVESKN